MWDWTDVIPHRLVHQCRRYPTEVDARMLAGLMGSIKIEELPLYRSLANQLRRIIADGTVPAGKRLPPEGVMSAQLGISRVTVTSAYRELREQGWQRYTGRTFVAVPSDGSSWVSMMGSEGSSVLDFVNAAPEASPFLAVALVDAVSSLTTTMAGHGYAHWVPRIYAEPSRTDTPVVACPPLRIRYWSSRVRATQCISYWIRSSVPVTAS